MDNKQQNKVKKTVNVVLNVLVWALVAFAVIVTIVVASANGNAKNVPTLGGNCYLSVLSDSMNADKPEGVADDKPSGFKKGNLIVGRYIAENDDAIDSLEVGDVITFEWDIDGNGKILKGEYNTHRIVSITRDGSNRITSVTTQGDNRQVSFTTETVNRSAILAVYTGRKVAGIGAALTFLGTQLGFGLCIILPLCAFFIWQIVSFVRAVIKTKNADKKVISAEEEEEIKRKAVEDYLKSIEKANAGQSPEENKEESAE